MKCIRPFMCRRLSTSVHEDINAQLIPSTAPSSGLMIPTYHTLDTCIKTRKN